MPMPEYTYSWRKRTYRTREGMLRAIEKRMAKETGADAVTSSLGTFELHVVLMNGDGTSRLVFDVARSVDACEVCDTFKERH